MASLTSGFEPGDVKALPACHSVPVDPQSQEQQGQHCEDCSCPQFFGEATAQNQALKIVSQQIFSPDTGVSLNTEELPAVKHLSGLSAPGDRLITARSVPQIVILNHSFRI